MRPALRTTLVLACTLFCSSMADDLGARARREPRARRVSPVDEVHGLLGQGQDAEAVLAYKRMLDRRDNPALRCEYAFALARLGLRDLALGQLDQATAKRKATGEAAYFQGRVLRMAGVEGAAKELAGEETAPEWLTKAAAEPLPAAVMAEDPKQNFINANRLAAQGQPNLAAAEFTAALRKQPQDALGWLGYSIALEKMGAIEAARAAVEKAAAISGKPAALSDLVKARQARLAPKEESDERLSRREARRKKRESQDMLVSNRILLFGGGTFSNNIAALSARLGFFMMPKMDMAIDVSLGGLGSTGPGSGTTTGLGLGFRQYWPMGDGSMGAGALGARMGYQMVPNSDGVATVTLSPGFTSPMGDVFLDFTVHSGGVAIGFTVGATTFLGGGK